MVDLRTCATCQNLREVPATFKELETSEHHGCSFCSLLLQGIKRVIPAEQRSEDCVLRKGVDDCDFSWGKNSTEAILLELFHDSRTRGEIGGLTLKYTDFGDTSHSSSFDRVKFWIKDCRENHQSCGSGEMRPLPTRVLDLGGETPSLNIYESRNELGRYGCLSHCWGSSQPVITESSNLDRHKERVEWSALPKTFQDAISFARYLQIRFLWIDSLCIIQDNEADWQRESAKMASIYQNAYVVLAATRSSNADGGCFSKTHTEYQAHEVYQFPWNGRERPINIYARRKLPHLVRGCHQSDQEQYRVQQFPLLTRAWTYQELLLGARIVHFAEHELVWECQESTRCQCGGVKTDVMPRDLLTFMKDNEVYPLERYSRLAKRWRAIVEEYSKLKLTCEKDKLPALSGLARYMQQYRTDRYLAGLWEDELPISLLWRPTEPGRTYRPSKYTAPSWSWASVVGKIYFPVAIPDAADIPAYATSFENGDWKVYAEVRRVDCLLSGSDPTGEASSGYIVLVTTGCWYNITIIESSQNCLFRRASFERGNEYVYFDFPFWHESQISEEKQPKSYKGELLIVSVLRAFSSTHCLVLRVVDETRSIFERVGSAQFPTTNWTPNILGKNSKAGSYSGPRRYWTPGGFKMDRSTRDAWVRKTLTIV